MGIDYVVALDCAAKETLGIEQIVNMVKARSRAEVVMAMARQNGDDSPPSEVTFTVMMNRNGQVEETQVSAQQLFDQANPLDDHRGECASCPANRDSEQGYGCYNSINYPIETDTEQWLLSRLPDALEPPSMGGFLFKSAMTDFAWDGEQARDMRGQGETFFRSRTAPTRTWSTGETYSGDQVFHMMFHVGHIGAEHAKMLCIFFGTAALVEGDQVRASAVDPTSKNAEQMFDFINALGFAAENGLDILVDG